MELRKKLINKVLALNGLATLADPRSLLAQIAMGVKTHEQFQNLLMRVEPEKRPQCYYSLASRLSFEAKSLDTYIAEAKDEAVRLPEWDNETKQLRDPGWQAQQEACRRAVQKALRESEIGILELTCRKCTSAQTFRAVDKKAAWSKALTAGWSEETLEKAKRVLCPKCSSPRVN